ncbi:MAG: hypothetical protein JWP44_4981 [Mucilaginibacter sp.]|nr:hypothetical protein [Mucilaginibacter sp.]
MHGAILDGLLSAIIRGAVVGFKQLVLVGSGTSAHKISIVRRRADADCLGSPAIEVAHFMGQALNGVSCLVLEISPEDLVQQDRVVSRPSSTCNSIISLANETAERQTVWLTLDCGMGLQEEIPVARVRDATVHNRAALWAFLRRAVRIRRIEPRLMSFN